MAVTQEVESKRLGNVHEGERRVEASVVGAGMTHTRMCMCVHAVIIAMHSIHFLLQTKAAGSHQG